MMAGKKASGSASKGARGGENGNRRNGAGPSGDKLWQGRFQGGMATGGHGDLFHVGLSSNLSRYTTNVRPRPLRGPGLP